MLDKIKTAGAVLVGCACVYYVGKCVVDATGFVLCKVGEKVIDVIDKKFEGKPE